MRGMRSAQGSSRSSWQDLIARCFPVQRRGRYAGTAAFLGALAGFAGSVLATWLLNRYVFPVNFALVFAIGTFVRDQP